MKVASIVVSNEIECFYVVMLLIKFVFIFLALEQMMKYWAIFQTYRVSSYSDCRTYGQMEFCMGG